MKWDFTSLFTVEYGIKAALVVLTLAFLIGFAKKHSRRHQPTAGSRRSLNDGAPASLTAAPNQSPAAGTHDHSGNHGGHGSGPSIGGTILWAIGIGLAIILILGFGRWAYQTYADWPEKPARTATAKYRSALKPVSAAVRADLEEWRDETVAPYYVNPCEWIEALPTLKDGTVLPLLNEQFTLMLTPDPAGGLLSIQCAFTKDKPTTSDQVRTWRAGWQCPGARWICIQTSEKVQPHDGNPAPIELSYRRRWVMNTRVN